jgi:hypothetical protein
MKSTRICIALVVILAPCSFSGQATPQPKQSEIDTANRLFQVGKFAEAGKLYSRMAAQNPKDYSATLQLGRIALLSNRLDDAQKWLEEAIALQPGDADAKVVLAEAFYRRDDFQKAAASLNGVEVPQFGEVRGTFSGGQHANVQQSRIESLTVGDWTIKNVPIATLACVNFPKDLG